MSAEREHVETVADVVRLLARRGDEPALITVNGECDAVSCAALGRRVVRLAAGLRERRVAAGDHVALYADNSHGWITACLGIVQAGAIPVPIDAQLGGDRLRHVLEDSAASAVFCTAQGKRRICDALACDAPPLPVYLLDDSGTGGNGERSWEALLAETGADGATPAAGDEAMLFYTAGTTGPPKGVPLTHAQLCFQIRAIADSGIVAGGGRVLLPLPLHHVYPLVIGLLVPFALGLPVILPGSLTGPALARAIRAGRATHMIGVPRLYEALVDGIRGRVESRGFAAKTLLRIALAASTWLCRHTRSRPGRRLLAPLHAELGPALRILASGGSPLDPRLAWRLEGFGWQVAVGYGLTETAPLLTLHPPGARRFDTVGWPVADVEIRIASGDDGGDASEILARGPNVFGGYHHLPEQTAEAFTADGWYRTGDLGRFTADGALQVLGRASTLMVTEGGENVQPDEVEAAYQQSPAIREIGVLERDRRLVAVVVPERGAGDGDLQAAVRDALRERGRTLPSYQRLDHYVISRAALPRTRLGDLQRDRLAERYDRAGEDEAEAAGRQAPLPVEELSDADRALLDDPNAKATWEWLCERYAKRPLTPDSSFALDLQVDSMAWLDLGLALADRTGIVLDAGTIAELDTVRDLLEAVSRESGDGGGRDLLFEAPERLLSEQERRWLEPPGAVLRMLRRVLHAANRCVMRMAFSMRVRAAEQVPTAGPWILLANHASYLDPFLLAAVIDYARFSRAYWGGWVGVAFGNPLTRAFSRLAGVIPVDPRAGGLSGLAGAATVLERGAALVWFPEGERSPDGSLQTFRPGIGLLLERHPVPIVPAYIEGTYAAWPRDRRLPRLRRRLRVTFGAALDPRELSAGADGERGERIREALRERIDSLARAAHGDGG